MTSSNEPPLSRRQARLAQQASQHQQHAEPSAAEPSPASFGGSRPSVGDAMEYRTEVRPRVPRYEPMTPASPGSAPSSASSSSSAPPFLPPTAPAPHGEARSRDFRPPAEHAGRPTFAVQQPDDAALDYRTQGGPVGSAFSAPVLSAPVTSTPGHDGSARDGLEASDTPEVVIPEYTMTRRELRALRAAQESTTGEPQADRQRDAPQPEPGANSELDPFESLLAAPLAEAESDADVVSEPEQQPAPLHVWQPTSTGASAPAPLIEPTTEVAAPSESPSTGSHWSAGFSEPADDPFENTFSRSVGSAAVSTSALVLPEMPLGALTGPVPGTGEIIITGMVDVPSSIASTGAVPSVHDSPELDDLVDAGDREFVSNDSAPVSAINAVSSHTVTRTVIAGRRPSGTMLTTILIVSTVVMAVAAVTIFVVAAANGLF